MSGLFRSESMVYARLVMSEEVAYATIKEMGEFGRAHIVDLAQRHHAAAPSDRLQLYKKRVAQAVFYERKLDHFRTLFRSHNVPPPSIDVAPLPVEAGDVLEEVRLAIEPIESSLTRNILYARDQRQQLNALIEQQLVLHAWGSFDVKASEGGGATENGRRRSSGAEMGVQARRRGAGETEYGSFGENRSLLAESEPSSDDEERGMSNAASAPTTTTSRVIPIRSMFSSSMYGTLPTEKAPLFERMIFRASRGNALLKLEPLPHPMPDPSDEGATIRKSSFRILYIGEQLHRRLKKILFYFGASEYEVPMTAREGFNLDITLQQRIHDSKQVFNVTLKTIQDQLNAIVYDPTTNSSPFNNWMHALRVEKAVCDTLKKCEIERLGSSMLVCEAWIPTADVSHLRRHLKAAVASTGAQEAAMQLFPPGHAATGGESPPTYFPTNKFTDSFQGIVDTYGYARYKECNPGLFTIITFPFLFGVMYGDIGHGAMLTTGALYFLARESYYIQEKRHGRMDEIMSMIFGGRYMLLLMGLFAMYCGFIYNDCFSVPFDIFGSRWIFPKEQGKPATPQRDRSIYPFGIDPGWYHASNELAFFNSLKMKLSVTLGVVQMTFGIALSAFNHSYNKDKRAMMFEFIPRMVFMLATFGYMIFLIVYKFCVDWEHSSSPAPNLVQTMIGMFLSPGHIEKDNQLYAGQAGVQVFLLMAALISIPIMLFVQPCLARAQHNRLYPSTAAKSHGAYQPVRDVDGHNAVDVGEEDEFKHTGENGDGYPRKTMDEDDEPTTEVIEAGHVAAGEHGPDPRSPDYSYGDHQITQGIHCIEFVLGCVSNTASYLRLWALSLAHAELSQVFWGKMIAQYGYNSESPIGLVIGVAVWCGATFGVLLCMDVLECFLHALRLHWVEFQNKFFAADGYGYVPFNFEASLDEDNHTA